MPRVLNRGNFLRPIPEGAVLVARPSRWGNPFTIWSEIARGVSSSEARDSVLRSFRVYARRRLREEPHWLDPLIGKDLVCYCAPNPCHADLLLELVEEVRMAREALADTTDRETATRSIEAITNLTESEIADLLEGALRLSRATIEEQP